MCYSGYKGGIVIKEGEIYRHCKGKKYEIIAIARDSDQCKNVIVVYKSLEDSDYPKGTLWTRPLSEFTDNHSSGDERLTKIIMVEIELISGTTIRGDLTHYGHKHPGDTGNMPDRKGWHYYKDNDTGEIHHLRKEHIIRVK